MPISTLRDREYGTDRYRFDFTLCTPAKGWAQIDTSQDAHYFGTWANPEKRQVLCYCEGDITLQTADTDSEFESLIRSIKAWNDEQGHRFIGIDAMCNETLIAKFRAVGLGDLLH